MILVMGKYLSKSIIGTFVQTRNSRNEKITTFFYLFYTVDIINIIYFKKITFLA